MRFIKWMGTACVAILAACASRPMPPDTPVPPPTPAAPPAAGTAPGPAAPPPVVHQAPARDWDEYKLRVARRIVQTSGDETFSGPVPERLQSIPVLQVQLNRDGSIRNIEVLRVPKFSPQTLQMAMKAIRRAAPFEPVGHLPRPWQYSETFLYNDDLKFQIRSLDEAR